MSSKGQQDAHEGAHGALCGSADAALQDHGHDHGQVDTERPTWHNLSW